MAQQKTIQFKKILRKYSMTMSFKGRYGIIITSDTKLINDSLRKLQMNRKIGWPDGESRVKTEDEYREARVLRQDVASGIKTK